MQRIIIVLVAIAMLCGSNIASRAVEKQPAGGEGGGTTTTAPQKGPTTTTTAPSKGSTKTPTKTVAQQCATACRGSKCRGGGAPAGDPTVSALQGSAGTSMQAGACKEYQQCMNQCINAHSH